MLLADSQTLLQISRRTAQSSIVLIVILCILCCDCFYERISFSGAKVSNKSDTAKLFAVFLCFCPLRGFTQCNVVGLVVVLDELAPQSTLRQGSGLLAAAVGLLLRHLRVECHRVLDIVGHLRVVVVRAVNHLHTVGNLALMANLLVGPQAEAGQVGGDAGHAEGHGLKRRVAPRLVVAGIDAEV